jgi:hypothetical protein
MARSTEAAESPSRDARKNPMSVVAWSISTSLGTTYSTTPFGRSWAAAATNRAFAAALGPETRREGAPRPLRAIAVFRRARRFRDEVAVDTRRSGRYPKISV